MFVIFNGKTMGFHFKTSDFPWKRNENDPNHYRSTIRYIYMCECVYMCVCACIYIYIYIYICVCVYKWV